jgi:predicted nucleotidyltransferase
MRGRKESMRRMDPAVDALQTFFSVRPEILLAYLFGSFLTKPEGAFRDIDIAVYVIPRKLEELERVAPYGYRSFLTEKLAHALRYDHVDLVLLNSAPPLLQRQVVAKGRPVFCRSESDRINFEVAALRRYADTAHLRRIKRLYMKQRIEEGLTAYA